MIQFLTILVITCACPVGEVLGGPTATGNSGPEESRESTATQQRACGAQTDAAREDAYDTDLSITHMDISLKIDFQSNRVPTVVKAAMQNTSHNAVDKAEFWLCPGNNDPEFGADVSQISLVDGNSSQDLIYTVRTAQHYWVKHGAKIYQVRLPRPVQPNEKLLLRFEYVMTGKPDFSSTPIKQSKEGLKELFLRGYDWLWCPELWVDFKPGDAVRRYSPSWTLRLKYPRGYVAVADGELLRREGQGVVNEEWKSVKGEMPRLYVGQYKVARRTQDGVTVEMYATDEELLNKAAANVEMYARMFKLYGELFGDPGPRTYRVVGSSHPDTVGAAFFMGHMAPVGKLADARLFAHEMAHTWWGYDVDVLYGPGYKFLTEAMAEFSAGWALSALGQEGFDGDLWNKWLLNLKRRAFFGDYVVVPRKRGRLSPLIQLKGSNTSSVDWATRSRGPLVLNHIRLAVGDEVFFRCLKAFVTRFRGTKAGIDDFLHIVGTVCGRETASELKDLLWGTGYDSYRLVGFVSEKADEGYCTKVTIQNEGDCGLRCPLLLKTKGGEQRTVFKVEPKQEKKFLFTTLSQVKDVVIDPDLTALQYHPEQKERFWSSVDPGGENWGWHSKSYMLYTLGQYPNSVAAISEYLSQGMKRENARSIEEYLRSLPNGLGEFIASYVFMRGVYYLAMDERDRAEADIKIAFPFMLELAKKGEGPGITAPWLYYLVGAIPEQSMDQYLLLLRQIAGREFSFPAGPDAEGRNRVVEQWTRWWEKEGKQKELDLGPLKESCEAQRKAFCQREPSLSHSIGGTGQ